MTLANPRFECTYPVSGVRAPVPPTLDVVLQEKNRAVLIESKLLEPWRSPPKVEFSAQYDRVAERISAGTAETMRALRARKLTYQALDAAQLLKHLFGVHSAITRGKLPPEAPCFSSAGSPSPPVATPGSSRNSRPKSSTSPSASPISP